ncbi:MAG: hypothetical protein GF393_07600 [Armatimonadia bacterium]|nr:hypothetical protein [Armatimonadia bacterium]
MTRITAIICTIILLAGAALAQSVELSNDHMTIAFDPDDGYAVSSLLNHAHEVDFIEARPEGEEDQNRSPWEIEVHSRTQTALLTAADAQSATHELDSDTLTITWTGVAGEQMPGDLTVTATVRLPEDSAKAYFRCDVSGETTGWLWEVDFPRVFGIRDFADCQMSLPYYWGRLVRKPQRLGRAASLDYPEPASMQWFSYWGVDEDRDPPLAEEEGRNAETGWSPDYSDAAGLYWAAEDSEVYTKDFGWDPTLPGEQMSFRIENIPGLDDWPMPEFTEPVEVAYEMPYQVSVGVFTGDWLTAAEIYREWATEQEWAQRGPVDEWADEMPEPGSDELVRWVPEWFRDIGFWAKYYHEPAKILPEWGAYRKWLGVPVASHWYRYNIARFNDNDPEHLPPDPYVLDGVRAARELGVDPMPYVLATIWDQDTQSWILEDGQKSALRTESGDIPPWNIGNNIFARMCLSQDQWHEKMQQICEKLIWEHGMSGVYLDVLAAGRPYPCYNPDHGHPIRGGKYWGQGARTLMEELRAHIRRLDPDACFFSEEIGEHLIDVMDGFLTLDITRNYTPGGEQVWPILAGAYHQHTIMFGSDAHLGLEPEHFAVLYGRQLIWGSQPLNSSVVVPDPEEGDPASEILREYTRAYYVAGQPWLMGGKMLRMAVRPKDGHVGQSGLELASDPHTTNYAYRDRPKVWTGPAVMASAWERFGDIGIVMANLTGEEQTVDLTVRGDVLGLQGEQMVRLWPEVEEMGDAAGERRLTFEPWQCAVLCITSDTEAAVARLNELDEMPWELEVVEDGPIPAVSGPAGTLFACSDGPVAHEPADGGVSARVMEWDGQGNLKPMDGRQAEITSVRAEGHGLPRALDEQPFALIRRLPHSATATDPGVLVVSGDEHHLLAVVPGGTEVRFAQQGFAVVSSAETGEVSRSISESITDRVTTPPDGMSMVGWASLEEQEMAHLLQFGDTEIAETIAPMAEGLRSLRNAQGPQRFAALAEASRRFVEVADSLDEIPGALSPMSPLTRLHERLNALLVAQLNTRVMARAEDRWLAPEVEKPLQVLVQGAGAESVALTPVGFWRPGNFETTQPEGADLVQDTAIFDAAVRMDDGLYVERVVPVVAAATVTRGGQSFEVADVLRLEANRPYQVLYDPLNAPTMVAGHESTVQMTVRNWSPLELTLSVVGSGPEGWEVTPVEETVEAPGLADTQFAVSVRPPADAERGRQEVRVVTNHASGEDSSFIAIQPVSVLDALVPVQDEVAEWERPTEEQRARIRKASKFALYVGEGEEIAATIKNIRVTRYIDTLSWSLLSSSMELLDEGQIRVDEEARVEHVAEESGTHYLEVIPKNGSADVIFENRAVAEVATPEDPLQLFSSDITRFFYVPEGSDGFALGAQDGGPTEGARFVLTSPTGRVAFEADGNYNGVEFPVEVRGDEAGDVWELRVEPRQDLQVWLTGEVMPYLSTAPERCLMSEG